MASTQYSIEAEERLVLGKKSKRLHAEGKMPAVLYGKGMQTQPIALDSKIFNKLYSTIGKTSVVELTVTSAGKKETYPVLFWNVYRHPVKGIVEHVDVYRVEPTVPVKVRIPFIVTGLAKGVKLGGKLEVYREYLDIEALPSDLVKDITLDVTEMDTNETVRIADISLPKGVTIIYDKNVTVLSIKLKEKEEEKA